MRLKSPWSPHLTDGPGTTSDRLITAISDDILAGRLVDGDRMPAHRDLGWTLQIGVGTVTKAYAALERRGLLRSIKGRGTFVSAVESRKGPMIDFSGNVLPHMISDRLLSRSLSIIARRIDSDRVNLRPPPTGHDAHRRLLAHWLESIGVPARPDDMVLTGSGQQALWLGFDMLCGGRGLIITERFSYSGAISLARHRGHPLRAVAMDAEGMCPADLDRVLHAERDNPKQRLVYVTPDTHNPTTRTMGLARRHEIIRICRAHRVPIVEDGVYSLGSDPSRPPLVSLAPEIVLHVSSLSKSLSAGLRLGVLLVPPDRVAAATATLVALPLTASPVDSALIEQWLLNGVAEELRAALRLEAARRGAIARTILDGHQLIGADSAFHLWLPMPAHEAMAFASAAQSLGVEVTSPQTIMTDEADTESGIRLCLGAPAGDDLTRGLSLLAGLRSERPGRKSALTSGGGRSA
ncbi:PLP-dependent aminotransferase family protein [Xinfangfangia sp. D13-10-4-6]|uniref:aminotransferase-like domain-containing protein n=1 Tax=Pseudogemmobacter hezensis TaxID=2737662 RepID=UPI001557F066|nr:PLP-dependent aminotransferase family protein [Pseudogemmobacter hezensis]NPD16335.1 PLP-dependent aminotransferase family protein [Pseudogemmobacter hezensis]